MVVYAFSGYFSDVLKLSFHDPRPFWLSNEIKFDSCKTQFGNPSGHSNSAVTFMMVLFFDYALEISKNNPTKCYSKPIVRVLLFLAATAIWLMIGYSRVLLGMHGWDQVIFGWTLGWWNACVCHFIIREPFKSHIYDLTIKQDAQIGYKSYLLAALGIHAVVLAFSFILYASIEPDFEV